jgi:hypothetical protein
VRRATLPCARAVSCLSRDRRSQGWRGRPPR